MSYLSLVSALAYPAPTHVLAPATTYAEFTAGLAALQPGQTLPAHGVVFPKETPITKLLGSAGGTPPPPARVYFNSACKFPGGAGLRYPSLWVANARFLQLVFDPLCAISNPYGAGIRVDALDHCVLDGFHVRNCGGDGLDLFPTKADIHHSLVRGEVSHIALDLALDPHAEKGTGLHCCNTADAGPYVFHDNVVAIHGHDCAHGGSVIEHGNPLAGNRPHGNVLYVKGERMTQVAKTQVAGNGLNLWGYIGGVDVQYVEVDTMGGRGVESAPYGTWSGVRVAAGTAVATRLSPWAKNGPVGYGNMTPVA